MKRLHGNWYLKAIVITPMVAGLFFWCISWNQKVGADSKHPASLSPALRMAYEINSQGGIGSRKQMKKMASLWKNLSDRDPSKIWIAMVLVGHEEYYFYVDIHSYLRSHRWSDEAASEAMDRMLSWDSKLRGFSFVLSCFPIKWLVKYARNASPDVLLMSNPRRVSMLLGSVAGSFFRARGEKIPPWLYQKLRKLATLGGVAAVSYVLDAPDEAYLLDRFVNVANSTEVEDGTLYMLKKARKSVLEEHKEYFLDHIHRKVAIKILLKNQKIKKKDHKEGQEKGSEGE